MRGYYVACGLTLFDDATEPETVTTNREAVTCKLCIKRWGLAAAPEPPQTGLDAGED